MKTVSKYIPSLNKSVNFFVGENAADNFNIIDNSLDDDIWFHVQGFSSGHVIAETNDIKMDKKQLRQIITQGAIICKQYSKYSYMSDLAIIYTQVKHVEKTEVLGCVNTKMVKVRII